MYLKVGSTNNLDMKTTLDCSLSVVDLHDFQRHQGGTAELQLEALLELPLTESLLLNTSTIRLLLLVIYVRSRLVCHDQVTACATCQVSSRSNAAAPTAPLSKQPLQHTPAPSGEEHPSLHGHWLVV